MERFELIQEKENSFFIFDKYKNKKVTNPYGVVTYSTKQDGMFHVTNKNNPQSMWIDFGTVAREKHIPEIDKKWSRVRIIDEEKEGRCFAPNTLAVYDGANWRTISWEMTYDQILKKDVPKFFLNINPLGYGPAFKNKEISINC